MLICARRDINFLERYQSFHFESKEKEGKITVRGRAVCLYQLPYKSEFNKKEFKLLQTNLQETI